MEHTYNFPFNNGSYQAINVLISNQHGSFLLMTSQVQLMDNHYQTDLILLDFSKAFDTVPHRNLLAKLQYCNIIILYGSTFSHGSLNIVTQSMVVDGASFKSISVLSCKCSARNCTGPFKVFIVHDITDKVSSTLCLFTDDCILYWKSKSLMTQYLFKKTSTYYLTGLQYSRWTSTLPNVSCLYALNLLCQFHITIYIY